MKTIAKKSTSKATTKNASTKTKKINTKKDTTVNLPKLSKRISDKLDKIKTFEDDLKGGVELNNWKRLQHISNVAEVELFGMNDMIRHFIAVNNKKKLLSPKIMKCLTFKHVVAYVKTSKYSHLSHFTAHQVKLICNAVIKEHNKGIAQLERAEKQSKKVAKI